MANLNLATTDTWMDRQSGQRQERTEWHRVVMFNKTAEIAQQYLKRAPKFILKGAYKRVSGKTKTGKIVTRQKLSLTICRCLMAVAVAIFRAAAQARTAIPKMRPKTRQPQ